jgi:hypothetical protein
MEDRELVELITQARRAHTPDAAEAAARAAYAYGRRLAEREVATLRDAIAGWRRCAAADAAEIQRLKALAGEGEGVGRD